MTEIKIPQQFPGQIDYVRSRSMGVPKAISIDLSVAINDQEYDVSGNLIYILMAPDDYSYVGVKLNENREYQFSLYRGMGFVTPFHRLFITTPAGQTGTIILVYGTESPLLMNVIDNRSATSLAINAIQVELQGDSTPENWNRVTCGAGQVQVLAANANRKAWSVCANPNNTANIYLGFDNTVTNTKYFHILEPGDSYGQDDYRGAIHAISTIANQYLGMGEW